MITCLAVAGYRSLRDLALELGPLTVVTGANGSGKSSLYRALRLLAEIAQGRLITSLAQEGGLASALWAGPEQISRAMRSGAQPLQGIARRKTPIALKLGFSGADFGYAIDLGLPIPGGPFERDPQIKLEAMWLGETLGRSNLFADRRGPNVRLRRGTTGAWRDSLETLSSFDSMLTHAADPDDGRELLMLRERLRSWRFYDNLRTDQAAPARRPQIMTYTPVLAGDGTDLAAALTTILYIGDGEALATAVDDAFPGSTIGIAEGDYAGIEMRQPGLLRPLSAAELSEGTLRYLLLVAALLSPRPPELMILNEPETSLHPSLLDALARLLLTAAERSQIILVSHSAPLIAALAEAPRARRFHLEKDFGETVVGDTPMPHWVWPVR